jgi:hypothetical protein
VATGAFFPLVLLLFDDEETVFPMDFLAVEDVPFVGDFFADVTFFVDFVVRALERR